MNYRVSVHYAQERAARFRAEVNALRELPDERFDMAHWVQMLNESKRKLPFAGYLCMDLQRKEVDGQEVCGTVLCFAGNIAPRHWQPGVTPNQTIPDFAANFLGIPGGFSNTLFLVTNWLHPGFRLRYEEATAGWVRKDAAIDYFLWYENYVLPYLAIPVETL